MRPAVTCLAVLLILCACDREDHRIAPEPDAPEPAPVAAAAPESNSAVLPTTDMLPDKSRQIWEPWLGDFDGMVERRVIRVVVPFGGYQFYYQGGRPRGANYELLMHFENYVNEELGRRNVKVHVLVIPVSGEELIPALLDGNADLVAANLTITDVRKSIVEFTRPLRTGINEIVVSGPAAPPLVALDDLSGQPVFLRRTSSYVEHLSQLGAELRDKGLEPPQLSVADDLLSAEDIMELVNAGAVGITIMDDYQAEFWKQVFPDITVRNDLVLNEGGAIAWAMRRNSPGLAGVVDGFLKRYGRGTLVGNDTYNRYLADAKRVRCANSPRGYAHLMDLVVLFRKYGEQYNFNWLMLAAQGYQESGLRQSRKSPAGAIGIMQIKPSTAADRNVGINDISTPDANIHAGTKYMRFLADRYFSDAKMDPLNQWLFTLAAYNAGPARIAALRREAATENYDPNQWFNNVEIIAARRIGRETVTYVSNVFKYYIGYQLGEERETLRRDRFETELTGCALEEDD